ncbi:DNA repair protein RAD50-like [Oopsacas minuta]|uniref:DNA repair protein RAD50-like n=1 Tax=Oopsacas minuta TaxID=111878 RepID=A0AAV7JI03_9METZ|nr:DNA repair protein RAD50-like [Oopsacas minuta]
MKGRKRLDFSDSRFRLRNVFYIHCPGYPKENSLRREIIKFGGKVENFLSKDVHVLITNQPGNDRRDSSTPLSPLSACTSSSRMWADSPRSTDKPSTAIVTRGKALALQAAKMQCNGSTDVVENSRRLGVRVWSLEAALRAVKRAKRQENRRADRPDLLHGTKRLKAPFLKVDDTSNRFKPLFVQFDSWPVMEFLEKLSLDPGFEHGKLIAPSNPTLTHSSGQLSTSKRRVQPLVTLQRLNKLQMNPLLNTQPTQVLIDKSPIRIRKHEESTRIPPAINHEQKASTKKQQTERRGYCEACLIRYSCLQEHRQSSSHQEFISNPEKFCKLDRVISEFLPIQQVVKNFSSIASLLSQTVSQIVEDISSENYNSPLISRTLSQQLSPYTPSKVRDSSKGLFQISFRPDGSYQSYKPTSPSYQDSVTHHSFITEPDGLSAPRILKPRLPFLPSNSNTCIAAEEGKRSYTIPIDTPTHGTKPEITLLMPSSSPGCSSMEWCESISQTCPPLNSRLPQKQPIHSPQHVKENDNNIGLLDSSRHNTSFRTPEKQNRVSHIWVGDAKTPPLPKGMDPSLYKFMNYPYRESKVNAFKKLSKLL